MPGYTGVTYTNFQLAGWVLAYACRCTINLQPTSNEGMGGRVAVLQAGVPVNVWPCDRLQWRQEGQGARARIRLCTDTVGHCWPRREPVVGAEATTDAGKPAVLFSLVWSAQQSSWWYLASGRSPASAQGLCTGRG